MRKMSKNAWVFQMTVHGVEPDNDAIIQELINESGGLMIGKRKFSKDVSYLLVVDLLALDILMTGMAEAYPCEVSYLHEEYKKYKEENSREFYAPMDNVDIVMLIHKDGSIHGTIL